MRQEQEVDMITFAAELDELAAPFLQRLCQDRSKMLSHFRTERLAPVFGHQNHLITDIKDSIISGLETLPSPL